MFSGNSISSIRKKNFNVNSTKPKPKSACKGYTVRKTPLYHNSLLWAPDNQPLCTCDPRKAQWYIEKDLGEKISDDPFIVRLKFEPSGRPQKEGGDGFFYLQERFNICAVCGKDNSFFRKSVVPHEYRKHFPEIMKAHQSHDVLLLCVNCHLKSNQFDNVLRYRLAEEHDAPIGYETDVKVRINADLKSVRSAGGALLKSRSQIPQERIDKLESILKNHYGVDELTPELIKQASELDLLVVNKDYVSHNSKVYKAYEKIGLVNFELKWRQYFLDTMKPKHLPTGWSVHHNHKKLKLKMSRLPLDDPDREYYKIALVGTEGTIDVPYIPQNKSNKKNQDSDDDDDNIDDNDELDNYEPGDNNDNNDNEKLDVVNHDSEEIINNGFTENDEDYDVIIEETINLIDETSNETSQFESLY